MKKRKLKFGLRFFYMQTCQTFFCFISLMK